MIERLESYVNMLLKILCASRRYDDFIVKNPQDTLLLASTYVLPEKGAGGWV